MTAAATPTFADWSSALTAAETAAKNSHANTIERLEAQRAAAENALEKATTALAEQRKAEGRARHRRVAQKVGTDLVAACEALQRGGREQAAAFITTVKRAHQMHVEYLGEPLQPRELLGALVAIAIKSDRDAANSYGQCGRPFANGGAPYGVHLDSAGRLIDLALRGGSSSGEILRAFEACEIDVARGARQPRGVTRPEDAEAAKRIVDAWRFESHDVVTELIASLGRDEQARNTSHWQAEQVLAERVQRDPALVVEGRGSAWHRAIRATRAVIGGI